MKVVDTQLLKNQHGYRWQLAGDIGARRRGAGGIEEEIGAEEWVLIDESPGQHELYSPPADLFSKFAELEPDRARILDFANAYGSIVPTEIILTKQKRRRVLGELFSDWVQAQREFKPAMIVWRALAEAERGNTQQLRELVSWDRPRYRIIAVIRPNLRFYWPGSPQHGANEILASISPREILRPARLFLASEVSSHLVGRFDAALVLNREGTLDRIFGPRDLRSLLWLQLAEAASGRGKIRPCKNSKCNELILIDPRGVGNRTNRETCSDSCRVALYESRKLRAIELWRNERKHPEEIVRLLSESPDDQPTVQSVQRWIARALNNDEKLSARTIAKKLNLREMTIRAMLVRKKRNRQKHPDWNGPTQ